MDQIPPKFRDIVDEYFSYVYSLTFRILGNADDAADAVQETFLKLFKCYDRIDSEKNLKNWVCTVALNAARDCYRSRKRYASVAEYDESRPGMQGESGAHAAESSLMVEELLGAVPIQLRTALTLFYIEHMTVREIAQVEKIPEVLVKVRLHRARKMLLKKFGNIEL